MAITAFQATRPLKVTKVIRAKKEIQIKRGEQKDLLGNSTTQLSFITPARRAALSDFNNDSVRRLKSAESIRGNFRARLARAATTDAELQQIVKIVAGS